MVRGYPKGCFLNVYWCAGSLQGVHYEAVVALKWYPVKDESKGLRHSPSAFPGWAASFPV